MKALPCALMKYINLTHICYDTTSFRQLSIPQLLISQPNNKESIHQPSISQIVNQQVS